MTQKLGKALRLVLRLNFFGSSAIFVGKIFMPMP
jgi:hypothetical protein